MAEAIIMPKTGMAMEEGTIIEWLIKEGDYVEKGDPVAEIETDKSTMELETDYTGVILKILFEDGETIPVTIPIAWVGSEGEAIPDPKEPVVPEEDAKSEQKRSGISQEKDSLDLVKSPLGGKIRATPAARKIAHAKEIDLLTITPSGRHGEICKQDVLAHTKMHITPLAKRIAEDKDFDLNKVSGSGQFGKVFSKDLPYKEQEVKNVTEKDTKVPLTKIQRITGRRMLESIQTIPSVTEQIKVDVTSLIAMRKQVLQSIEQKVTINDFVLLAAAKALKQYPRMNSTFDDDAIIYKSSVNIGMAVAIQDGLVVPVIHDADTYTLTSLASRTKILADLGRKGKLQPDDMYGATFSVSNIGMYGINSFTPIINPPESGILGVCTIESVPKFVNGQLVEKQVMGLNLTFDHRVVDGAQAAEFLLSVKDFLEKPMRLLV